MKLFFSFSICIAAILLAVTYQKQNNLQDIQTQVLDFLSRTLNYNYNNNTSNISNTKVDTTTYQQEPLTTTTDNTMAVARGIRMAFQAIEQAEGAGARVRRSIGTAKLRNFSPFLMLDHFTIGKGAGFPDHPHRGQETITYLLSGGVDHEDFAGNRGTIGPGDLQFMTAGKGIMHAEMPHENEDGSPNVGMQLWVDLPAALKSVDPRYRDLRASEIPTVNVDNDKVIIKVISGQSHGVDSVRDLAYTPLWFLDITIKPGGHVKQLLPIGWNAFAYTLEGTTQFVTPDGASKSVDQFHNVVFQQSGDYIEASVPENAEKEARMVLVAGQPLDQPVVQYGPFVCTSKDEVYQAMADFQSAKNGFEKSMGWRSEIGKRMTGF